MPITYIVIASSVKRETVIVIPQPVQVKNDRVPNQLHGALRFAINLEFINVHERRTLSGITEMSFLSTARNFGQTYFKCGGKQRNINRLF